LTSRWLVRSRLRTDPRTHLICFPSAGAGPALFGRWAESLSVDIQVWAVQLPGREARVREPVISDLAAIAREVAGHLEPLLDRPLAFFGHSMGAVIAFETARLLAVRQALQLQHLFVSAYRPPCIPDPQPPLRQLPDDALITETGRRYGGVPAAVLAEPELLALLLPTLRADITALETHSWVPGAVLECPISAFGGAADVTAPPPHLEAWRAMTSGRFRRREFAGGHFYLTEQRLALVAEVEAALAPRSGMAREPVG